MKPFKIHKGIVIPLDRANVDTDAILPKQLNDLSEYLKLRRDMMIWRGSDYQESESDSRLNYTGRFDG